MTGSNLPPGCNESDIPGNRPRDIAIDHFLDVYCPQAGECSGCRYGDEIDACSHPYHPDNISEDSKHDQDERV